jgi:hypothetical protein
MSLTTELHPNSTLNFAVCCSLESEERGGSWDLPGNLTPITIFRDEEERYHRVGPLLEQGTERGGGEEGQLWLVFCRWAVSCGAGRWGGFSTGSSVTA